ncbi:MAG: PEGA domain-containing protein [Deltaproteobacteria bacterium]|nr:PEGA domain-containing protein [Deltaproteobacteria bacterium]
MLRRALIIVCCVSILPIGVRAQEDDASDDSTETADDAAPPDSQPVADESGLPEEYQPPAESGAPAAAGRRVVAALVATDPALAPAVVADLEEVLKHALFGRPEIGVLDLRRALDSKAGNDARVRVELAEAGLANGQQFYESLDADRAIKELTASCEFFEDGFSEVNDFDKMVIANLYLASVLQQTGQPEAAIKHYRAALFLDPKLAIDPNVFPPDDIDNLERVRRDNEQGAKGSVEIASAPVSARIYIDGVYRGATPLTISNLPAGDHFLRIERNGYDRIVGVLEVIARRTRKSDYSLIALPRLGDLQRALAAVDPERVDLGGAVQQLQLQLPGHGVVLLTGKMLPDGSGLDATVHYVDFELGRRARHSRGTIPISGPTLAPSMRALVDDALDTSRGVEPPFQAMVKVEQAVQASELPWGAIAIGSGVGVAVIAAAAVTAVIVAEISGPAPLSGGGRVVVLGF